MTVVYLPNERPEVEVNVDGTWFYGELRMWSQHEDRSWWANVTWSPTTGEHLIDNFPADRVRPLNDY